MALSEQETLVLYDYAAGVVRLYSTRNGPIDQAIRRLGASNYAVLRDDETGREIEIPIQHCRSPALITKLRG